MKILHLYKDYDPVVGGIENHIRTLAEGQAAAGHEVIVLVTNSRAVTRREIRGSVRVIKAARLAHIASTPLSLSLAAQLHRLEPDVAHLHFPYPAGEVANHFFGRGRRSVLTYHCDIVRQQKLLALYRPLLARVLLKVHRIIVSSPAMLKEGGVLEPFRRKCEVVPHGIVRERFLGCHLERIRRIRAGYGGGPIVLFVGVLRYYKGLQFLLRAMRHVEATLLVVGDGPMAGAWRSQAASLHLGGKVVFVGRVPDEELISYYQAADLFVLPASERAEAFGLVQLEAMAAGLPVVCTELGTGTSHVNRDGETGLVVAPRDPQALASAVQTLLRDDGLRRRLGDGARARSEQFSAEQMVARTLEIYEEVMAESPGGTTGGRAEQCA